MSKSHLVPITVEQREESKQKRLKDQQFARENYQITYQDEGFWREKASEYGLRMPSWWVGGSETKYIRRACKKLGVDVNSFVESTGFSNLGELARNNAKWTAFGLVGLVIEFKEGQNV